MQLTAKHPPTIAQGRWQTVRALLALNLIGFVASYISAHWDIIEHAKGAVDRFWYPPHFGIYFGLLVSACMALGGLLIVLRTSGLPFDVLRQNAALTMVAVANGMSFLGAPFDAWWHATFGLDLTIWSPPHLHLLIGAIIASLGCAVYFLDDAPLATPLQRLRQPRTGREWLLIFTLVLGLLQALFLFMEYELGVRSRDVLARPRWTYPLIWPFFVTFFITLYTAATRRIGMATLVTVVYGVVRLATFGYDRVVLDFPGIAFYPLVLPALVFDLSLAYLWPRWGSRRPMVMLLGAGCLVAIVIAVSTPLFWGALHIAPGLNVRPWINYWPIALVSGILGTFPGWWSGSALRRLRPAAQASELGPAGNTVRTL